MPSDPENDKDLEIQREILSDRKFSLGELIAREGGGFLKGESPVPKLVQVITEINMFISANLSDSSGALQAILHTWVQADEVKVSEHLNSPMIALREIIEAIVDNPQLLYELVKQVDRKWGQMYDERPYFQRPGQSAHPDDEYTHESVRKSLIELLNKIP
ncbi:MAG: hypothetical protein QNJ54_22110 [Prochloraceae cyanobacterium]|nr:hypothetical protein [Prochloraceae cyanobacterium]